MAQTIEELMQENQQLREELQLKDQRIQELEKVEKEHEAVKHKQLHDQWVSGKPGRGVR
jgi:Tfp pilus assembly protein PilN